MPKPIITPAMVELRDAITEAEALTKQETLSKRDELRLNVLLAKIAAKRATATTEDVAAAVAAAMPPDPFAERLKGYRFHCTDLEKRWFAALQNGPEAALRVLNPDKTDQELRDMLAGSQTITYTQTQLGGTLIPNEFVEDIFLGLAEVDPLFDSKFVTLIKTKGARPLKVPGWDLSTVQAARITEATQQPAGTFPPATTQPLGGWTYRVSLAASMEIEQDDFEPVINQMKMAFTIAIARGVGKDLVNGNSVNQPNGLVTTVPASGVTLNQRFDKVTDPTAGNPSYDVSKTLNDQFQQAYFSIDHIYRKASTCCWIMNDRTYQWIRSLTDHQGRPLLDIRKDKEEIMGKPVLISPSMPAVGSSPIVAGKIVFGDLSRFLVRCSEMTLIRATQLPGYVEKGEALYTAHIRVDSQLHDPTSGGSPALVSILIN